VLLDAIASGNVAVILNTVVSGVEWSGEKADELVQTLRRVAASAASDSSGADAVQGGSSTLGLPMLVHVLLVAHAIATATDSEDGSMAVDDESLPLQHAAQKRAALVGWCQSDAGRQTSSFLRFLVAHAATGHEPLHLVPTHPHARVAQVIVQHASAAGTPGVSLSACLALGATVPSGSALNNLLNEACEESVSSSEDGLSCGTARIPLSLAALSFVWAYAQALHAEGQPERAAWKYVAIARMPSVTEAVRTKAWRRALLCGTCVEPGETADRLLEALAGASAALTDREAQAVFADLQAGVLLDVRAVNALAETDDPLLRPVQGSGEAIGTLERAVLQRNVFVVARTYSSIHLSTLASVLFVSEERAESITASLVASGALDATIDQVSALVFFTAGASESVEERYARSLRIVTDTIHTLS
jgi:hypothetical protein